MHKCEYHDQEEFKNENQWDKYLKEFKQKRDAKTLKMKEKRIMEIEKASQFVFTTLDN